MSAPKDYIRDFMSEPVIDVKGAALVIIDIDHCSGQIGPIKQGRLGLPIVVHAGVVVEVVLAEVGEQRQTQVGH